MLFVGNAATELTASSGGSSVGLLPPILELFPFFFFCLRAVVRVGEKWATGQLKQPLTLAAVSDKLASRSKLGANYD